MVSKKTKYKKVKIVYKKLGRKKIHGQADKYAEIDPRLMGVKQFEIIMHECLHVIRPQMTEEEVEEISIRLTKTLWHEGYRKVDLLQKGKLQDGSTVA